MAEMIPFSVIGFLIASQGIMKYIRQFKLKTFLVLIFIIYTLFNYNIFTSVKGTHYHGFKVYLTSISIFICFAMFPSEKIKNKIFIKIIRKITNHTAGIYYLHLIVYSYFKEYFIIFKNKAEGVSLINQIKSDNPKVIGIKKIEYEIPVDLPFSMGTPENTGILTIIKEVKLFTYFYQNKFIHYVFEKSCINKYYDEKFLFQNNYDFEFAKRFFIFLKESSNFETEVNEGNEEKFYKNKIRFIQKKRNK